MLPELAVSEEMKRQVLKRLIDLESEREITVLWAIESGSRAWGFWRPESDYDVRYIYVYDSKDRYLSPWVERKRDVIGPTMVPELDLDMMGWDLRKVVQHIAKSNPNILEWLYSPIEYDYAAGWVAQARELAVKVFDPKPAFFHYSSIAKNAMTKADNTGNKVLKRQLYALRCICAALWVMNQRTIPPMDVTQLFAGELPANFLPEVMGVVLSRRVGQMSDDHWFTSRVVEWIREQIELLRADKAPEPTESQQQLIEDFFIQQVNYYGD